ncbi:MAG: S8 family serine peptidase [Candidatus Jordarchaeaceae archaeon]
MGEGWVLSWTFLGGAPVSVSVSGELVWTFGFLVFIIGDVFFFASFLFLIGKLRIREAWLLYVGKVVVFLVACVTVVQRGSGYFAFNTALLNASFYLDNGYTGLAQLTVLASVFLTLSLVLTADLLLRGRMVEGLGEKFYLALGTATIVFGLVMIFLTMLIVPFYSFYAVPGFGYFYSQGVLLDMVDSFELVGVYFAILGCVIICFKESPPLIRGYQLVGGSILTLLALPLSFVPFQIWVERYILYSPILASLDLGRIHGIFPLNFNFYTFVSMTLFTIGVIVYVQNSKFKTVALILFLVYIYFYPGLSRLVLSNYYIPTPTPTVPILVYLGLAMVAGVVSMPMVAKKSGWDIVHTIRGMIKPSARTMVLLLVILALIAPILALNGGVNSAPLAPVGVAPKSLTPEDRIDPTLLNLVEGFPQSVPVILRFKTSPLVYVSQLSSSPYNEYFTFEMHNGKSAVYYEKAYYAVYGNVSADNNTDLRQKLVELVAGFDLAYVLFSEQPLVPPDIDSHYAYYFFVGADILRAWNITGRGATVAVVDSGVNDFSSSIRGRVVYQVNFLTGQEGDPRVVGELTPESPLKHGTEVAELVAGVKGIAPEANIIDLKIKSGSEESFYMNCVYMAEAIDWCVRNKDRFNITVIALALGSRDQIYGFLTDAVDRAFLNGIVVIVAGGGYLDFSKNRVGGILLPGIADWGITVAATLGLEDERWSPVSPIGPSPHWYLPKPELTGPGPYTSGSVPMVAGITLLLAQRCDEQGVPPILKAAVIRWSLIAGAQEYDLGPPGWDIFYGFGRANALTSFLYLVNYLEI